MTEDSIASLRRVGASLTHIGNAVAESCNHAGASSAEPLRPLDHCLGTEVRNLQREGHDDLAAAVVAFREFIGASIDG